MKIDSPNRGRREKHRFGIVKEILAISLKTNDSLGKVHDIFRKSNDFCRTPNDFLGKKINKVLGKKCQRFPWKERKPPISFWGKSRRLHLKSNRLPWKSLAGAVNNHWESLAGALDSIWNPWQEVWKSFWKSLATALEILGNP